MTNCKRHTLLLGSLILLLAGCAAYPAFQVAGSAMTGYDAMHLADDYLPRESVDGGQLSCTTDNILQRRLRERLALEYQPTVSAHVINREAYLVGRFTSRDQADKVVRIASDLQGLTVIHCKFYPMAPLREAQADRVLLRQLATRLTSAKRLTDADLRIEVINSHAILIGRTGTWSQKTEAVAIASEINGIRDIVDYIVVTPSSSTPEANKLAAK